MKICQAHWDMIRQSIETHGMDSLVTKTAEGAAEQIAKQASGVPEEKNFDPLLSHHWYWSNMAMEFGGLYLLGVDPSGANDGKYCPVCEAAKHASDFEPQAQIDMVSKAQADWARSADLLPPVS